MRARYDEIVCPAQKIIFQNFRQREIKKLAVKHGLHLGIAALHRVAYNHHVDIAGYIFSAIACFDRDAPFFQKNRYRRINIFVRAGHLETAVSQRRCHGAHCCPANPEEMKTFRRFPHAHSLRCVANFASETKSWPAPAGRRILSGYRSWDFGALI